MDNERDLNLLAMDLQFFANDPKTDPEANKTDPADKEPQDNAKDATDDNKAVKDDPKDDPKPEITEEMKQKLIEQGKADLLEELGLKDNDDGNKFLAFFKSFMENQNNENPQEETPEAIALKKELVITEAKVEALKNGVKPEFVDDVVALALNKKKEDEKLGDVVINLKSKYDFFFGADENDEEAKGTGTSRRDRKAKGTVEGIGARLATQRKPKDQKQSYWN